MTTVIAVKRIHKTKAGGKLNLPDVDARALVALGLAYYPPQMAKAAAPKPVQTASPQTYLRRDMTAEKPVQVFAPKPSDG